MNIKVAAFTVSEKSSNTPIKALFELNFNMNLSGNMFFATSFEPWHVISNNVAFWHE